MKIQQAKQISKKLMDKYGVGHGGQELHVFVDDIVAAAGGVSEAVEFVRSLKAHSDPNDEQLFTLDLILSELVARGVGIDRAEWDRIHNELHDAIAVAPTNSKGQQPTSHVADALLKICGGSHRKAMAWVDNVMMQAENQSRQGVVKPDELDDALESLMCYLAHNAQSNPGSSDVEAVLVEMSQKELRELSMMINDRLKSEFSTEEFVDIVLEVCGYSVKKAIEYLGVALAITDRSEHARMHELQHEALQLLLKRRAAASYN